MMIDSGKQEHAFTVSDAEAWSKQQEQLDEDRLVGAKMLQNNMKEESK